MLILQALFLLLLLSLLLPALLFTVQITLSLFPHRAMPMPQTRRPSLAVLIPAHNESTGIIPTLQSLKTQLIAGDRIVLVADNCTDDTAGIAVSAGIEVIERVNLTQRGKGFALDFGMRHLANEPPEVVVIVDADCIVEADGLERLARTCMQVGRPVQALYLMRSPQGASLKTKIAEFAWAVKDWARPLGYLRLGLPCQLMGTGMAFPWALLQAAELATGHIVEDLKLGLEFANARKAPLFCPEALVTSVFPLNTEGVQSQRTRWEHGHLGMIIQDGPRELWASISGTNFALFSLVLDMCVPPLALLMLMVIALSAVSLWLMWLSATVWPWMFAWLLLILLGTSVMAAWVKFGRSILSLRDLLCAPLYILSKVTLYLKFLIKRQVDWVRSSRDQ